MRCSLKRLIITRFRDAGVLDIKNRIALNLAKTDFTKQVNLQEVMDIKRFCSFQNVKRVLSWVFTFFNNLKQKLLQKTMLSKDILDKKELKLSEEILSLTTKTNLKRTRNVSVI